MARLSKIIKTTPSKRKPARRLGRTTPRGKPQPAFDPEADLAERIKIGKMLDIEAFDAFHKSNTASMKYWQTPDHSGD